VLKPERRDLMYSVRLPATLSPIAQVTIYAKVSGYLKSIYVDKGDTVRAGQLLAVIDNPELGQKFQQAKSEYAIKKLTYDRLANVRKENADVIAQQDVDVSEGAYLRAKHALEELQSTLAYTNVRAPFGGVITARFADAGALVQAATSSATQALPLLTLMNMSTIRVYANVSQNDAALVKPGIPSFVSIAQLPGRRFEGTVTRTTGALDPTTRTMLVEMHLPNKEGMLQPGMFAEAVLQLKRHPNALALPPAALVLDSMGTAVFVVEGDKVKKVPIRTGIDDGVWVEVTEGLTGGENVVVVGKSRLTDGTAVAAAPYNIPPGKSASQQF
jgi:membrane fusion protein (multidrug efflux system)